MFNYDVKRRRSRTFGKILSFLQFAKAHNQECYFLTLTSSHASENLQRAWEVLIKRIRRRYGLFEYVRIRTSEGCGVLHVIFKSHRLDINWIRSSWKELNKAPQMKIIKVWAYTRRLAGYFCSYLGKNDGRYSSSSLSMFPNHRNFFVEFRKSVGYPLFVYLYTMFIESYDIELLEPLYNAKVYKQRKLI